MPKAEQTVLEINLNALEHNFKHLKSKLEPQIKFLAVVKAFAYGSDVSKIANHLQNLNVDYLAVAYVNEGVALRDAGITLPILVLHPQAINLKTLIERCLEPSLYNDKILNAFIEIAAEQNQKDYPVHIKFNTGLNRLGFSEKDIESLTSKLKRSSAVKVKSLFSHLAESENENEKQFTLNQIKAFRAISIKVKDEIGYKMMLHMCNTSGVLNYPDAHFDMVRCGIGLYGFANSIKENEALQPITTLKTIISQIHNIKKGESVGYNRAYINTSDAIKRTATLPIGHADGIGRHYGNGKTFVTINNQKAQIIGNVCMDMIMVDITDINCQEGDEVIIFGNTPNASDFAKSGDTISYEIITAISQRVKRVFLT